MAVRRRSAPLSRAHLIGPVVPGIVLAGHASGALRAWCLTPSSASSSGDRLLHTRTAHSAAILAISPVRAGGHSGTVAVSVATDGSVVVWQPENLQPVARAAMEIANVVGALPSGRGQLTCACVFEDGHGVAAGRSDGTVLLMPLPTPWHHEESTQPRSVRVVATAAIPSSFPHRSAPTARANYLRAAARRECGGFGLHAVWRLACVCCDGCLVGRVGCKHACAASRGAPASALPSAHVCARYQRIHTGGVCRSCDAHRHPLSSPRRAGG